MWRLFRARSYTRSARRTAQCDKRETAGTGSELPGGFDRHRDEEPRPEGKLLVVDDDPTITGDNEVEILDAVFEVVVLHGLSFRRQLDHVGLESTDGKSIAYPLIERARSWMRSRASI